MPGEKRVRHGLTIATLLVLCVAVGGCATVKNASNRLFGKEESSVGAASVDAPKVELEITGVDEVTAANVRAHLRLSTETCDAPQWRVERRVEQVDEDAREGLKALGFYEPEVSASLEAGEECWQALVEIVPGPPVLVDSLDIQLEGEGGGDPAFRSHLSTLPIRLGETLNHQHYEAAKNAIRSYALEHGYLDGSFKTSRLSVDIGGRKAHVEVVYITGRRYRLGEMNIDGNIIEDDLVDRLAGYEANQPYDSKSLVELNRRLSESGYFERVDVRPRLEEKGDGTIPVDVTLTPRKKHAYSAGAGLTTDAGPRLRLGYENRRLNRRGHRWSARTSFSLIEQSFNADYRIPLEDPRTEWLTIQAGAQRLDTDTSQTTSLKLGVSRTQQLWGDWLETRFLSLIREDFEVGRQNATATLLIPGINLSHSTANDPLRPTSGYRVFGEIKGTHEAVGSDTSFLRFFGSAGWVRGVPWGGRILVRTDIGAMSVSDFDLLPPSQRFFTGGDTSVRGYAFESLGPSDEFGNVIGGQFLFVGSFEYEHPIKSNWSLAAFVDAGNAFDLFDESASNEGLKVGVGAGVRWHSPIGPIRLDLAHPLDGSQLLRLHLRLGPDL